MKSSIVRTLITFSLSAAFIPTASLAQSRIDASIPFAFTAAGKTFAAGDYYVQKLRDGVLLIQPVHGNTSVMTVTHPGEPTDKPGNPVLTFHRYGERYFLSAVSDSFTGWQLFTSGAEKELIARQKAPQQPVVIAAGGR